MKIIIIVIAQKQEPYITLEAACRNTWASVKHPDIQVLYLHAQPNITSHIDNDELIVEGDEGFTNIGYKTIKAFEYCLNHLEFDYVYRTNISSYVDQYGLYDYATTCSIDNIYSGIIGDHNGIPFASGCGYLISKNLMQYAVDNRHLWDHISHYDDVSLAKVLQTIPISPTFTSRVDICTDDDLQSFDSNIIGKCFHFRCKNANDRSHDVRVMNMLYQFFITHNKRS